MIQAKARERAVVAFSGGLDTSFCVAYLIDKGYDVFTVTVDGGGFSSAELAAIEQTSVRLGALAHRTIDARKEIYQNFAAYIIKGNILRGGVYPLCVGVERTLQAQYLAAYAKECGADVVCHGCTGAGNDQVRFDVALQTIAPELKILAPVRELEISRAQEIAFLAERGINISGEKKRYSINQGIMGVTIGGGETHDSWNSPPEEAYLITRGLLSTPREAQEVIVSFADGLPVSLDGKVMEGFEILRALNHVGGTHGVGRGIHMGDTILGIKGRIAFEAPGAFILISAHRELEKLILTKWQLYMKEMVADFYGMRLHEGGWFEPVMRDCEALMDSSQRYVHGDVRVRLLHGHATVLGCRSKYSLMDKKAVYGEGSALWSGSEAQGFCKLAGLQSMLAAHVQRGTI